MLVNSSTFTNYSLEDFFKEFPDDEACLEYIFRTRVERAQKCLQCGRDWVYYRIKERSCYSCACGYQISPKAGTIFHKSQTSLIKWFLAIYYASRSNKPLSARILQKQISVTYKCAWRIAHSINKVKYGDLIMCRRGHPREMSNTRLRKSKGKKIPFTYECLTCAKEVNNATE